MITRRGILGVLGTAPLAAHMVITNAFKIDPGEIDGNLPSGLVLPDNKIVLATEIPPTSVLVAKGDLMECSLSMERPVDRFYSIDGTVHKILGGATYDLRMRVFLLEGDLHKAFNGPMRVYFEV